MIRSLRSGGFFIFGNLHGYRVDATPSCKRRENGIEEKLILQTGFSDMARNRSDSEKDGSLEQKFRSAGNAFNPMHTMPLYEDNTVS